MMRELIERYTIDGETLATFHDIPLSCDSIARRRCFVEEWLERLMEVDFDALDLADGVDYALLKTELGYRLRALHHEATRGERIREHLPFADDIIELEHARRRIEAIKPEEAAHTLNGITESADKARKQVRKSAKTESPTPSASAARAAASALDSLLRTLEAWTKHYSDYKPEFNWWIQEPYERAQAALKRYAKVLHKCAKDDDKEALVGEPIGREALMDDLRRELIPYGPDDLVRIAEQQLEWCLREIKTAAAELGFGDDWRAALEHTKNQHVALGQQDALVASLAREAIDYVDEHELVTVDALCRELWYVDMISEEDQRKLPYQAYGFNRILVSYPTQKMDHRTALMSVRSNNIHFMRAVTHHELIPGHHLQFYMARRHSAHRRIFSTPFLSEGWCLHWEMLLWDLRFPQSPEDKIGMLFWRMHRCARITVSLKYHLGEMSPEEMVEHLMANVGHERAAAMGEVRRYIGADYSPLYQCAYMIGGLQMRALYRELVEQGAMTPREFHDAVLLENAIPIELIRARLTGAALTRDFEPQWLFEG